MAINPLSTPTSLQLTEKINELVTAVNSGSSGGGLPELHNADCNKIIDVGSYIINGLPDNAPEEFLNMLGEDDAVKKVLFDVEAAVEVEESPENKTYIITQSLRAAQLGGMLIIPVEYKRFGFAAESFEPLSQEMLDALESDGYTIIDDMHVARYYPWEVSGGSSGGGSSGGYQFVEIEGYSFSDLLVPLDGDFYSFSVSSDILGFKIPENAVIDDVFLFNSSSKDGRTQIKLSDLGGMLSMYAFDFAMVSMFGHDSSEGSETYNFATMLIDAQTYDVLLDFTGSLRVAIGYHLT